MSTPAISNVSGTGYKQLTMPRLNSQQSQGFQQTFGALQPHILSSVGQLGQLASGSPEAYQALEAPAFRDLQAGLGQIASRFSGMGSGARRSSGFGLATSGAAQELAERLQGQRLNLQQNAISQLMSLYGNLMGTQTFDSTLIPKSQPFWKELLGSASGGLGQGLGNFGAFGLSKLF